ncbi:hypothetical protein E2C01_007435 [Portunus trituberculatus]|uniref:Uncharacterized protein n=1 Tax=Portunus trituberculatus TaxID=210409 RepID=A0A5B7D154_PORTR|nr:hypothetical protein [Portunus trituberculatus]
MAWKSKVSSQLNTSTKRPSWLPRALTDSVLPVPAGPGGMKKLSTTSLQRLCHGEVAAVSERCLYQLVLYAKVLKAIVKLGIGHVDAELLQGITLLWVKVESHLAQPIKGLRTSLQKLESNLFSLPGGNPSDYSLCLIQIDSSHPSKHLFEVFLKPRNVLAVANNLQQVLISHKIESIREVFYASPGEGRSLSLQVLAKGLLYFAQQISQALQGSLDTLNVEYIHHHRQQSLDVGGPREDPLQVDPAPLHVNPHIKEGVNPVQFLFPEIIPATDQLALVLVVDKIQLITLPGLPHLLQELFQGHLTLGSNDHILDNGLILHQVHIPHLPQVALLEGVTLQFNNGHVHLGVALQQPFHILIACILTQAGRQGSRLLELQSLLGLGHIVSVILETGELAFIQGKALQCLIWSQVSFHWLAMLPVLQEVIGAGLYSLVLCYNLELQGGHLGLDA